MSWFNFLGGSAADDTLPDIFPIPILEKDFVKIDVQNIYTRILTDVLERTQGIAEKNKPLLWDNCLASEKQDGLVTLLACAMADKKELFLVYAPALNVVRKATQEEETQIRDAYKVKAEPVKLSLGTGLYVTFKNYCKSDLVKFYSALEYCAVGGLWKAANISKSVQIKINELRASVSLNDSAAAKSQAKAMAVGMSEGRDILCDAKDVIQSLAPDMTATNATLDLIAKKQSFYLCLPPTYFGAESKATMHDTGKGDSRKVEQGLKGYFFSIVKPVAEGLFGGKLSFKSDDAEGLETALKTLETMDRTSNEFMNGENKTLVVNKAFGLDADEVGEEPVDPEIDPVTGLPKVPAPVDPNAPPPKPGAVPPKPGAKPAPGY